MHVLTVDDESISRLIMQKMLSSLSNEPLQFEEATDGAQAVSLCEQAKFDLILMDLRMPVMDGFEATRRIRKQDAATPIVVITGEPCDVIEQKAIEAGASAVYQKPVNTSILELILGLATDAGRDAICGCSRGAVRRDESKR